MRSTPLYVALLGLLILGLVALPAVAQRDAHQSVNDIEVYEDGSLLVNGLWYESQTAWQQSDEFKLGGHRCASEDARNLRTDGDLWDKAASDCSMSSTTIKSQFVPSSGSVLTIPVVFHIISQTSGTGNIADSFITSQIAILNEDFRALTGTPGAPGNDTRIQFVLASTDPNGNATTGINRVTSNAYFTDPGPGAYNDMKDALNWDPTDYLNIYTNDASGALGYATFPAQDAGTYQDGVVLLYSSVGRNSPGGIYNQGRTGTHEVGHYLGLFHTFQGGCGTASAPYTTGDLISDTNRQQSANFNCPTSATSCSSADPIRNYMNYTQDTCMWEFTLEQANRMRCSLDAYRSGLVDGTHGGSGGGTGGPTALTNGVAQTGLSGAASSEQFFTLAVPSGASNLTFNMSGGTGDADLYVKFGSAPTTGSWDCRPYAGGNNESCPISPAQTGTYHVMIRGYSAFSGVSLVGSYTTGGGSSSPCTGGASCEAYSGTLSSGGWEAQPNGTYYQSTTSGTHQGWLEGPGSADFDLELRKWNGSTWAVVASSLSATSSESISYSGTSGYYYWRIISYSGSGSYDFWMVRP